MDSLEHSINIVKSNASYQLLKAVDFSNHAFFAESNGRIRTALCIDTETTGFSCDDDKIIEIAIIAFQYNADTFEIVGIEDCYSSFEDPEMPIPPEVTAIHGITDIDVAGSSFDDDRVISLVEKADLVIAHSSDFDRKFLEKRFPCFIEKDWACSKEQYDWKSEGATGRSLDYLLFKCASMFINKAHRAMNDAEAVLALLISNGPKTGKSIFKTIFEKSQENEISLHAVDCPFGLKDLLKERGYKWSDGGGNGIKAWFTVIPESAFDDEMVYLSKNIYNNRGVDKVLQFKVTAKNKFSSRVFNR